MNEWNIQTRSQVCENCQQPFADQQAYHTLLRENKQTLIRSDLCESCWQTHLSAEVATSPGFISHWQGVFHKPVPVVDPIQRETAETLLRKLIAENNPQHGPAAYILAVMLERKRLLKVKETFRRDGQRFFVYEHPAQGDIFTIKDPDLHLDELSQVQTDVAALMERGLNSTPAVPVLPMVDTSEPPPQPAPAL